MSFYSVLLQGIVFGSSYVVLQGLVAVQPLPTKPMHDVFARLIAVERQKQVFACEKTDTCALNPCAAFADKHPTCFKLA